MRRPLALAAALSLAAAGVAAPAEAAKPRSAVERVCSARAPLYESPGGPRIGIVLQGRAVVVLKRTPSRRWVRVRTTFEARGWLQSRHLCED